MRLARLLRLTAVGLAVLAFLDPPVQVAPLAPLPVTIGVARSPLGTVPAANMAPMTRAEASAAAAGAIRTGLGSEAEVSVIPFDDASGLPCDAQTPCVIVTDGVVPIRPPADRTGHTSVVRIGGELSPNVRMLRAVSAPSHRTAEGILRATLDGRGVAGQTTRVQVRDGEAVIGQAAHTWTDDGQVDVVVPWWPLGTGQRRLTITAITDEGEERTVLDNSVTILVPVEESRWPILVYDRRPAWSSIFVRRALERDARFEVDAQTTVAPAVSLGTGVTRLDDLDRMRVVIVGGVDALTASDVSAIEAYMRRRGGIVLLVPDRLPTGPAARLLAHRWRERLTPVAERAGPFTATEWLVPEGVDEIDAVAVEAEHGPVVLSTPSGEGRLVVAGAMDAWRHRGEGDADGFDAFWRSLVADLARVSGDPVEVSVTPRVVRPGDELAVAVRARSSRPRTGWEATATLLCSGQPEMSVRLWPGHASGRFDGVARPDPSATECVVRAAVDGLGEARASVLVTTESIGAGRANEEALAAAVQRSGGLDVGEAEIPRLIETLQGLRPGTRTPESRFPMRSAWWLAPFVAALAGEWWLRRRAGLR